MQQSAWSAVLVPILFMAFSGLVAGCANGLPTCEPPVVMTPEYVRVDYHATRTLAISNPAEVSETPVYLRDRANWGTIALRVPNNCLDESAARATGESRQSNTILTTTCAFWLKELERALVTAGYRVISWDALHVGVGNMSTYTQATSLGADIVLLINSLESNAKSMTDEAEVTHTYLKSNANGDALEPQPMSADDRTWLRTFVKARTDAAFRNAAGFKAHAATLDVTAIVAQSGEAAWFYRRSLTRAADSSVSATDRMNFLFAHWNDRWWPVLPAHLQQARAIPASVPGEQMSSQDVESDSVRARPEDAMKALELELVRTIVDDFVTNFKGPVTPRPRPLEVPAQPVTPDAPAASEVPQ